MTTQSICFITPRLPPALDGLGDYCRQLFDNWSDESHCEPSFSYLVLDGVKESRLYWDNVNIQSFEPTSSGLLQALEASKANTCVLQYVGYGFARNGSPFWLVAALKSWKSKQNKIITMFHETWAEGRPWQKVFWQTGRQKQCAAELLDLSQTVVTSNKATFIDLKELRPNKAVSIIPIGCSFKVSPSTTRNWRQLLIMGKEPSRLRALKTHKELIAKLSLSRTIDTIVLGGQANRLDSELSSGIVQSWNLPVKVLSAYNFSRDNVPDLIKQCGLSLMHAESTCLLKSTSFQLAAQLGQVAIVRQELNPEEPFKAGVHFLSYTSGNQESLIAQIRQTSCLEAVSQAVSQLGGSYLSWKQIVKSWREILSNQNSVSVNQPES